MLKSLGAHNHLAEPEISEKQKAYADLKKRAAICKNQPPGSLIATFSMELEKHVLAKFPAIEHTKKTIYNQRRKELPPLPNDLKSLQIPNELQGIKFGEQELPMVAADTGAENGDQRIIVFAIQPHLEYLKNCETLICHGTFDAVPLLTYQLYTIHGLVGDIAPPLLFALLPNKNTLCYDTLLELVKKVCPEISPKLILTDFEKAAINAFGKAFPLATLGGCRFHLAQAIIRNVNECGLKHKYINDHNFRIRVKCLQALSFIPEPIVIECFELISGDFEDDELAVLNYFERTYIGAISPRSKERRQPQYSLEFWNMRDRSLLGAPLTTNHSEGWHARLNSTCGRNNPNIWQFLDLLKSEMGLVRLDLLNYKIGGERRVRTYVKDSTKKLQNLCLRELPNSDDEKKELLKSFAMLF